MDDDAGQPITSSKLPTKDGHQLRFHSKFELIKKEETKKQKTKQNKTRDWNILHIRRVKYDPRVNTLLINFLSK